MIYTKDNPKLVKNILCFENKETFTGVVEDSNGNTSYYLNGKAHREDGPAITYAHGRKEWFLNGKRHREDGHAIELVDGYKSWYLNGKYYGMNDDFTNESWIRFVKLQLLK